MFVFLVGIPMVRRSQQQWRELIQVQQESGLSAVKFCKQYGVNAKYFRLRKNQLLKSRSSEFVRLQSESDSAVMDKEPCSAQTKTARIRVIEVETSDDSLIDMLPLILKRALS